MARAIFQLKVTGFKRAKRRLEQALGALTEEGAENTVRRSCELIKRDTILNIVVGRPEWPAFKASEHIWPGLWREGDLSRSFKTTYLSQGRDKIGVVYSDVEYAPFHERGTHGPHGVPARPFLWPAVTDNIQNILEIAKEEGLRALKAGAR